MGGIGNTCGECLLLAHGSDPWNLCVGHGEGQGAEHVHEVAGGTKPKCTSSGSGVWQPLEGSIPVGDELVKDPRRVSEKVHVETRDGRSGATMCGTRLVEFGKGCEVVVKIPCVSLKRLSWLECLLQPDSEGNLGLETITSYCLQWGLGSFWCSSKFGIFGLVGCDCLLG